MEFYNTYEDAARAAAYDELEFGGTYHLAFRDLPALLQEHVEGDLAVDFGCGTGRSTRLLKRLGFRAVGLDISAEMVARARAHDPRGDYRVLGDGDFSSLSEGVFDLVLSAFTFDNIPGREHRVRLFSGMRSLLRPRGRLVNIVSTPEMYTHEWVTFTTRGFSENLDARCGDIVRIVTTDYSDGRPVEDILWPDEDYRSVYREAGLELERLEKPLATGEEGIPWVSETAVAPWAIYVLRAAAPES
jgi:SAM-dependent methyltransferase